jgi:hypothetical protein
MRNGEDTVSCEEDGEEGGRLEKKRGEDTKTRDKEEGLEKQRRRNGADTVRCEEDEEEGGGLEKRRRERTENRE